MASSATKTKVMLITTFQKMASLPENEKRLNLQMNGEFLETVTSGKLLAVTFQPQSLL